MSKLLRRLLPRKNRFTGVDIGTSEIKVVEIQVSGDGPEVVARERCLSPPGVWTEHFDEEELVQALHEVVHPHCREVITCIGGVQVISRVLPCPPENEQEPVSAQTKILQGASVSPDQLICRQTRLNETDVLHLAVPAAVVYRYYGIFCRAGLTVVAIDLQFFALWRLFGELLREPAAIVDIGAGSSHLVIVKDGLIRFARLLPAGAGILTAGDAPQLDLQHTGIAGIAQDIRRLLEFYAIREGAPVTRIILTGGASKLDGITDFLLDVLNVPVEPGEAGIDPEYAVALGLALRQVTAHG